METRTDMPARSSQIYLGGAGLLLLAMFLPSIVLAWTLSEESDPDD